jgi:hypothetical protein
VYSVQDACIGCVYSVQDVCTGCVYRSVCSVYRMCAVDDGWV